MNVGAALQADYAAVEVHIPIHCTLDNNVAAERHYIAIHRAINGDRATKRDKITTEHLIAGNHEITADERPMSGALITPSWELLLGSHRGSGESLPREQRSCGKEQ
ncbi:hypothetical protein KTAU_11120 [Thermogemmatispora aurantia]|uniref:Uncharacterized protein n=1 Tax=Thermogemmatispora aurantia TaxID=2045279 RepID=A0A5J4K4H0_9CHLR|nr:hypothetical protein KTAU_11120 [Thermogemmatispora aurantia]